MYIHEQYSTDGVEPPPQRTLDRSREGPRMDERGTGSCAACMGGATAMDLDSGVVSALSEVTNGDMVPPEAELVRPHTSSPPYAQTHSSEGSADQSDGDSWPRQSIDQESDGATAVVTTAHDHMPRVSSSTSISSLDDRYQMRMKVPNVSCHPQQATDEDSGPPSAGLHPVVQHHEPGSLGSQLRNLAAKVSENEESLATVTRTNESLEQELKTATAEISEMTEEQRRLQKSLDSTTLQKETLEQKLKTAEEEIEGMKSRTTSDVDKLKHDKEEEIEGLRESIRQQNEQLEYLKGQISRNEIHIDRLRQERDQLQEEARCQEAKNKQERDQLQRRLEEARWREEEIRRQSDAELRKMGEDKEKQRLKLVQEHEHKRDELRGDYEQQRDTLNHEIDKLEQQRDELRQERDRFKDERDQVERERDEFKQERDQLEQQRDELRQERDRFKDERDQVERERDDIKQERDQLEQQRAELRQERDRFKDERDQVERERDNVKQERDQLEQQRDELRQERDRFKDERDQVERERDNVKQERDQLQRQGDELRKEKEKLKDEINNLLSRIHVPNSFVFIVCLMIFLLFTLISILSGGCW